MRSPFKTIAGLVGLGLAIYWSVKGVDFKEVMSILGGMDRLLTAGVLILTTINLLIRSIVWKFVVSPIKQVPVRHALSSYLIGVFSNLFLPFKLGDVAQGYYLGRREAISKVSVVSAVLVQRVFEVTSLFLIMLILATTFSFPLLFQKRTVIIGILVLSGVAGLFFVFKKRAQVVKAIESLLGSFSPKLAHFVGQTIERFLVGTMAIHNWADVVKIMSLSLLSWVIQIVMVYFTSSALGIDLDVITSSIVLLIINLGLIIPLAPGNIGTFQFFCILALSLFSVTKSKALTFSIIFQAIQGLPVIIGGGISVFQDALSTKRVRYSEVANSKRKTISSRNTTV